MSCLAGILLPTGMLIYAWSSFSSVHWIVQVIGLTVTIHPPLCISRNSYFHTRFFRGQYSRSIWRRSHIQLTGILHGIPLLLVTKLFFLVMDLLLRLHLLAKVFRVSLKSILLFFYFTRTPGNMMSTILPLFTDQMFRTLGYRWANTLFGLVAVMMLPIPFVFVRLVPGVICSDFSAKGVLYIWARYSQNE